MPAVFSRVRKSKKWVIVSDIINVKADIPVIDEAMVDFNVLNFSRLRLLMSFIFSWNSTVASVNSIFFFSISGAIDGVVERTILNMR